MARRPSWSNFWVCTNVIIYFLAIRDEPRRRMDEAPGKRAIEQDQHTIEQDMHLYAITSAFSQQQVDSEEQHTKQQSEEGEVKIGEVADEDQDSEPSTDEDGN